MSMGTRHFDWWGFFVRGFIGGILGMLLGWRAWIAWSRNKTLDDAWGGLVIWMAGGFLLVGIVAGLAKPSGNDFWKRP
jgi:H+/Cl- antiporter ClcA